MSKVEWKKLGDVCDITTGNCNKEDAVENGRFPFFVRSKEVFRINRYLFDEEAVIIPGEGGIGDIFHYVKGKYGLHQRAYRIHPKVNDIYCKFIYYYLVTNFKQYICQKSVSATVTSIRKPMLEAFCFPKPLPKVQQQIVEQLDTFTTLIAKLESELTLRQKQYEFYREELLNFDGDNEVEWKRLGVICDIATGAGITNKDCDENGLYPVISGGIEPMGYYAFANRKANTVTVSRVGANAGYVNFIAEDFYLNDKCFSIIQKQKNNLLSRFLFHQIKYKEKEIRLLQSEGGVPTINKTKLGNIMLCIPPIAIQKQIVSQLDTFEQLIAALKREIALRQKQYEFYREKLLTFE